jgi:hypothetical protein
VGAIAIFAVRHPKQSGAEAGSTHAVVTSPANSTLSASPTSSPTTTAPSATSTSPSKSASASSSPAAAPVSVVVLNNTTTTGLAGQVAKQFRQAGWDVTKYDNYQNDIISTCAYYDPNVPGAKAAAEALQATFPGIKRVEPQFGELAVWKSPIVVIIVQDWLQS